MNEAVRDWVTNVKDTFYYRFGGGISSVSVLVRDFQSVIGREARRQFLALEKKLPDYLWLAWRRQ